MILWTQEVSALLSAPRGMYTGVRARLSSMLVVGLQITSMSTQLSCSSQTRLTDLPGPSLYVDIPQSSARARVSVFFPLDGGPQETPCKLLAPQAKAAVNGEPLTRLRGKRASDDLLWDHDCFVEFGIAATAIRKTEARASVRIWDDSAKWELELPTAFSPRSFVLTAPSDGVVRGGKRVVVKWSPRSDQIDGRGIGFELYPADSKPGSGTQFRNIEVRGDEMSVTIPPSGLKDVRAGRAFLRVLGTNHVQPELRSCPVQGCKVTVGFDVPPVPVIVED